MKQAVLLFEWNRPRYLRVCLDSLDRCKGKGAWDVLVSVDRDERSLGEFLKLKHSALWHLWPTHAGNLWHVTRSLEWAFSLGYDRVLFSDGDVIFHPDALAQSYPIEDDELFHSLVTGFPPCQKWFNPFGLVLEQSKALGLLEYVNSEKWVASKRPGHPEQIMARGYTGYDAVYCRYLIDHNLWTRHSERSLIAHIGLCGVDCNEREIEAELFTGAPETWLDNAIRMFDPKRSKAFIPHDFVYPVE